MMTRSQPSGDRLSRGIGRDRHRGGNPTDLMQSLPMTVLKSIARPDSSSARSTGWTAVSRAELPASRGISSAWSDAATGARIRPSSHRADEISTLER